MLKNNNFIEGSINSTLSFLKESIFKVILSFNSNSAVYNAMLSRGYTGEPIILDDFIAVAPAKHFHKSGVWRLDFKLLTPSAPDT
jgi:hypothetical protein